eukprot:3736947-Prymnesium_polylepis.1
MLGPARGQAARQLPRNTATARSASRPPPSLAMRPGASTAYPPSASRPHSPPSAPPCGAPAPPRPPKRRCWR